MSHLDNIIIREGIKPNTKNYNRLYISIGLTLQLNYKQSTGWSNTKINITWVVTYEIHSDWDSWVKKYLKQWSRICIWRVQLYSLWWKFLGYSVRIIMSIINTYMLLIKIWVLLSVKINTKYIDFKYLWNHE